MMLDATPRLKTLARYLAVFFICNGLLGASSAAAQNVLSIGSISASPGDANVTIPIDLDVDQGLSLLRFNLTFDAAFCGIVANRGGDAAIDFIVVGGNDGAAAGKDIVIRRTGRMTGTPQEATGQCEDGSIDLGVFDITGNAVIAAGQGAVFEIEFDVKGDAGAGDHTLTVENIQADGGLPPRAVAVQQQSGVFTVEPLEVCGNGVIEAGEACDDGNTNDGDGCSAACQIESLDHFLCYKIKESRGNICAAGAALNAGGVCDTEEDCGGESSGDSATKLCIRNKFPKGIHATLADEFEHKGFDVKKAVGLCNPADKNDEGITDSVTHLKAYRIGQLRKSCSVDAPLNRLGVCKKEPDCGGVQRQTSYCRNTARFELVTSIQVDNQFGTVVLDTIKAGRLLVPTAKDLEKPTDAPDPDTHNLDHFKCYTAKVSRGQPKFPRDLQAFVVDQFNQPKRYAIQKPKRLCVPVDKNDEGIKNAGDALTCYPVKKVSKTCALGAPQNPLAACRREEDCGGVRRQTKHCQIQPKHNKVLDIHVNNQFGPERLDTKGEEELCVPSQIRLQP